MKGGGIFQSGIWTDTQGATYAVEVRHLGVTQAVEMADVSLLGANSCTYGVWFTGNNPHLKRVNFFNGATQYPAESAVPKVGMPRFTVP